MSKIHLLLILLLCWMPNVADPASAEFAETMDAREDPIQLSRHRRIIRSIRHLPMNPLERPRQTSKVCLRRRDTTRFRRFITNKQIRKIPLLVCDSLSGSEDH